MKHVNAMAFWPTARVCAHRLKQRLHGAHQHCHLLDADERHDSGKQQRVNGTRQCLCGVWPTARVWSAQ